MRHKQYKIKTTSTTLCYIIIIVSTFPFLDLVRIAVYYIIFFYLVVVIITVVISLLSLFSHSSKFLVAR